jgi:hydroxyethylthiazole kinase-like sugar kinase family protein
VIERVCGAAVGSGVSVGALIAGAIAEMVTLSFAALTSAMLYYDLRARAAAFPAQRR